VILLVNLDAFIRLEGCGFIGFERLVYGKGDRFIFFLIG